MKIAYVTTYDASDVASWSGTGHFIGRSLEVQSLSLDYVGPLRERYALLLKGKQAFYRYLIGRRHLREREPAILDGYARQVSERLSAEHDLVFSPGTIPIAHLDCEQPIAFWTDATFAAMVDFYPSFSKLSSETIRHGHAMERSALSRSRLAIYSSDWAARSAIETYGADPATVAVVPFGSNLEPEVSPDEARAGVEARLRHEKLRLLFVGVDWERKRGEIAVDVTAALNSAGLDAELDVVGCAPPSGLPAFVNVLGFISKEEPQGQRALRNLLMRSHFLILPSRAECTAVVLSEANAHAVPVLATHVGGIPTIVRDGVNGRLFATDAPPAQYCSYVSEVMSEQGRYCELALSSFDEYRRRLNWTASAATVRKLLEDVVTSR